MIMFHSGQFIVQHVVYKITEVDREGLKNQKPYFFPNSSTFIAIGPVFHEAK